MKIKADFVTNSSSSSFIVLWPKIIKTLEDIEEYIPNKYAQTVFNDAKEMKPVKLSNKKAIKLIIEELDNGWPCLKHVFDEDQFQRDFFKREKITEKDFYSNTIWRNQYYKEEDMKKNYLYQKFLEEYISNINSKNYYLYIFEYGDESEYFAELENGDIFRNLKNIRVNKH